MERAILMERRLPDEVVAHALLRDRQPPLAVLGRDVDHVRRKEVRRVGEHDRVERDGEEAVRLAEAEEPERETAPAAVRGGADVEDRVRRCVWVGCAGEGCEVGVRGGREAEGGGGGCFETGDDVCDLFGDWGREGGGERESEDAEDGKHGDLLLLEE